MVCLTQSSLVYEAEFSVEGGKLRVFLLHHIRNEVHQRLCAVCGLSVQQLKDTRVRLSENTGSFYCGHQRG